MCQVQRVLNTCGHRNDHVLLSCHLARLVLPQPEPISHRQPATATTQQSLGTAQQQQQQQQQQQPTFILSVTNVEIAIAKTGFQACSQPYCIFARVRELASPVGFKCMVEGCGRAD
ncbi:uncharacterized protein LDX57_001626 [Aspergillus melleus]|uniref:uncharacterized protein n=1 Tax=Aspergillus melleus TaxID=138277 RepID=UPI001E8CBD1D|nr:uncharacterized protein LDX57_001626 [Aspergillus melleus]KAH8423874.1 hypothetical protein LDX57_001626 [Aspergillus melleus]